MKHLKFRSWLAEMASFSIPPQEHFLIPCNMMHGLPCKDNIIGAIDMRFEGPPAYDAPFNKFTNGSKFIAKLPSHESLTQYLVYHGGQPPAQILNEEKAKELNYPLVPDYWFERAELFDVNYNIIKPALGDYSGQRQAIGVGTSKFPS